MLIDQHVIIPLVPGMILTATRKPEASQSKVRELLDFFRGLEPVTSPWCGAIERTLVAVLCLSMADPLQ